jgi:hypothetical protein
MGTQPGFAALPPARKRIPFNEVRQQIITSSTGLLARLTARIAMPTCALMTRPHEQFGLEPFSAQVAIPDVV